MVTLGPAGGSGTGIAAPPVAAGPTLVRTSIYIGGQRVVSAITPPRNRRNRTPVEPARIARRRVRLSTFVAALGWICFMKLDGGTVAALVVAGTGVCSLLLNWRSGAGRARSYSRLGQLLDMRAKVPDVLPSVRGVIDIEIVRLAEKIGPLPRIEDIPDWIPEWREHETPRHETHEPNGQSFTADVVKTALSNSWPRLIYALFLLGFGEAMVFSGDLLDVALGVGLLTGAFTVVAQILKHTVEHVRLYHRSVDAATADLPAIPEPSE